MTAAMKTDPALERLARELASRITFKFNMPDQDAQEAMRPIILQTLAPLAEVVEAAKKLGSEVGGLIGCNEIALREIAGHTNVNILDLRHRDLFQSLAKLDAGREE